MQKDLKLAAALKLKKYRDRENLFLAEGVRTVETALLAGAPIKFAIFSADDNDAAATEQSPAKARKRDLIAALAAKNIPLHEVTPTVFAKISATKTPAGILAVVAKEPCPLAELGTAKFLLVMDEVRDSGNAGAIIRAADAFAADGVVLLKNSVDPWGDKTVRAAMGSLFHVPIAANVSHADFLAFAAEHGFTLAVSLLDKSASAVFDFAFDEPCALVVGGEAFGVSADLMALMANRTDLKRESIFVPMPGSAESLNVANAAAVMLYERMRQKLIRPAVTAKIKEHR